MTMESAVSERLDFNFPWRYKTHQCSKSNLQLGTFFSERLDLLTAVENKVPITVILAPRAGSVPGTTKRRYFIAP